MIQPNIKNPNNEKCQVCKDLLANLQHFLDMLKSSEKHSNDWLTVNEVAKELKISRSIVYRLIRNRELEAVDIVDDNGKIARKGHYRIKRQSLENYLSSRKIKPTPQKTTYSHSHQNLLKVKNHLGL